MSNAPRDPRSRVDLHGLGRLAALQRVRQTLTRARALRMPRLEIVTGRGLGSEAQSPVLRTAIEAWLRTTEARQLGVVQFTRTNRGGALDLQLRH